MEDLKDAVDSGCSINTLKCHGKPSKVHPDPHIGILLHEGRHVTLESKEQYNAR